jgi:hypothetical protein
MYKQGDESTQAAASEIVRRYKMLADERVPYEKVWDDITEFVVPSRGTYVNIDVSQSNVERKSRRRLDATATNAHRAMTARVIAEETNAGSRWFDWRDPDPEIDQDPEVRKFLYELSDKHFNILNSGSFRMAHIEVTSDWGAYGTACMMVEDNEEDNNLVFKSIPLPEIYISENKDGDVDTVYRRFTFTARQAKEFFGYDALPHDIQDICLTKPHTKLEIIHCVEPNSLYDPAKKNSKFFTYKSTYVLVKQMHILREGFFKRKPYVVLRFWKRSGEVYGGSPAMDSLPDIRMLNVMKESYIRSVQLAAAPPMGLAHDSVVAPLRVVPNGINYGVFSTDGKRLVDRLFDTNTDLRSLRELMIDTVMAIRSSFFVDPLINRENSIRTAAEVNKRSNEEMTGIAPFLSRYEVEYLIPVLDTLLNHSMVHDKTIKVPQKLRGRIPKIEFTGPLAKTQRGQELNNTLQFMQVVQTLATADPSMLANIDMNVLLHRFSDLFGVPQDILKSAEEVAAEQQRAQMQQQMQQLAQAIPEAAGAAADLSKAGLISRQDIGLQPLPEGF